MLKMEEMTAKEYLNDWAKVLPAIGIERLTAAVETSIQASTFFPAIAVIRQNIPPEQQMRAATDPNCPQCRGAGWKRVDELGHHKRCDCWHKVSA